MEFVTVPYTHMVSQMAFFLKSLATNAFKDLGFRKRFDLPKNLIFDISPGPKTIAGKI